MTPGKRVRFTGSAGLDHGVIVQISLTPLAQWQTRDDLHGMVAVLSTRKVMHIVKPEAIILVLP